MGTAAVAENCRVPTGKTSPRFSGNGCVAENRSIEMALKRDARGSTWTHLGTTRVMVFRRKPIELISFCAADATAAPQCIVLLLSLWRAKRIDMR